MDGLVPVVYMGTFAGAVILGLLELIWVWTRVRPQIVSGPRIVARNFSVILLLVASALLISTLVMSKTVVGFGVLSYVVLAEFVVATTIHLIQRNQL
jgi:hypothetical protein